MGNKFTHSICDTCWIAKDPHREPLRLKPEYAPTEDCCFCGSTHKSGIYVRGNPDDLKCKGQGAIHAASA